MMTIIFKTKHFKHYGLVSFLRQIDCSVTQFKVLRFLLAHPRAHLCADSIAGALDITRNSLLREIAPLIKLGIVSEQVLNGITTFVLTANPAVRDYLNELSSLDACETAGVRQELFEES